MHPPHLEADVDSTLPVSGACDAEAFLRMRDCNLEMYMIWRSFSGCREPLLPYEWDVQRDVLTISMATAKFRGTFSEDGKSFSGGWRPDPGKEGPENVAYDVTGTRVS